jgi:hypothetical protein
MEDIYTWLDIQRLAVQRRSNTQLFASDFPQEAKTFSGGEGGGREQRDKGNLGVSIDSPGCRACPGQAAERVRKVQLISKPKTSRLKRVRFIIIGNADTLRTMSIAIRFGDMYALIVSRRIIWMMCALY